jgi:glucokinase
MTGDKASYIGVDIGGTGIKWATIQSGRVIAQGHLPTAKAGGQDLINQVAELGLDVGRDAAAVGMTMPGTIDTAKRQTLVVPNVPGQWHQYPIAEDLEGKLDKPVTILNDARAFGYAELHWGAARGARNALFLTLGTGIGGAIARDGQLVIEEVDAFEVGHLAVAKDGPPCGCGAHGCLETVASATALVTECIGRIRAGDADNLQQLMPGGIETLSAQLIAQAAESGDETATKALEQAGRYVGMAAASCCLLMHVSTVVIGGGLSGAFSHLAPSIREALDARRSLLGEVPVLPSSLGPHAGAIGAALYASHNMHVQTTHHD